MSGDGMEVPLHYDMLVKMRRVINDMQLTEYTKPVWRYDVFTPDIVVSIGPSERVVLEYVNSMNSLFRDFGGMCALMGEHKQQEDLHYLYLIVVDEPVSASEARTALHWFLTTFVRRDDVGNFKFMIIEFSLLRENLDIHVRDVAEKRLAEKRPYE